MSRVLGALAIALAVLVLSGCANASPEQLRTQATIAAAQSNGYAREARAMEATAQAQAIERANAIATATAQAAPTQAPTLTPPPTVTLTPEPTATAIATNTPAPTLTPPAIVAAVTVAPTPEPTPQAPRVSNIYSDWPILFGLGLGALALLVILWRLFEGKTITLPGRGEKW